ncbi:hypothetical protein ACH5RR_004360 [Cinchona calisaya]|uniref:Spen paralogue and orthologue SPOC C-terminal domain-containing protein n=1 Tax=Cinchona calisaya TaxID=153742 RepID=A0ABD3AXF7_9GENT
MDKKILPSPGSHDEESFAMPSRKRKLTSSNLPEATSEFHLPRVLNPDGSFDGTSGKREIHTSHTVENVTSQSPTSHCTIGFPDGFLSGNENFPVNGIGSMSNLPLNLATQSSQYEGQPLQINVPSGGTVEVPNWTTQECPCTQSQAYKGLPFIESSVSDTGKPQLNPWLQDTVNSLTKNDKISVELPLEVHNPSSEPRFSQPNNSDIDFLGSASSGTAANSKNFSDLNHPAQYSGNEGIHNQPSGLDSVALPAYPEEKEKQNSIHHDVQHCLDVSTDNISQRGYYGRSNCLLLEPKSADEQRHHSSTGKALSNPESVIASSDRHNFSSGMSHKLDVNRLPFRKTASMGSEKLWDGSLQLNSAITMSAVAFFRSGERLVDINWSNFVEVKGKVKLDDFETYIQNLPRSRTRGLMIISVCPKEGSSDKELKSIKEVGKCYIIQERVGLATLSSGVVLYLCPRSDKIFTLLGGFLKGMTAIQGKSGSFIGCVVWRKNQTAASSVANEKHINISLSKESKKFPSDSSTTKQSAETRFISLASAMPLSAVKSTNVADKKAVTNSSAACLSTTPSVSATSSIRVVQQGSGHFNSSSQTSRGHPLESVVKQMLPTADDDDDDDLPEYDFGTLSGNAFTSVAMPIHVPIAGRHQTEIIKRVDGAVLPSLLGTYSISASNNQGLPQPRSVTHHEYATPGAARATSYVPMESSSDNRSKRNLFSYNDDDMPEWFPPQHQMPSVVDKHKPSAGMPSGCSASSFQNQQVPRRRLFHSQSPAVFRPEFSSQGFPRPHHPPTYPRLPPPVPFQNDPSSLTGFQCNPVLRPPPGSYAAKHTVPPAYGRARKP